MHEVNKPSPVARHRASSVALVFALVLGLWSPFALTTGGFLLYGFNADAPGFLARWSLLMALVLAAAARDVHSWHRNDGAYDAR